MNSTGKIPNLKEIADRLAIQDVLYRHCRGVDRADAVLLKSAYWPEAEVAYGAYNGPAHPFCENLPTTITKYAATQHRVTNTIVDFKDNDAVVESYVMAHHYSAQPDEADVEMTYLGRYIDHMQRRGDYWKIMFRWVVMDWNQNVQATAILKGAPFDGLARGQRLPGDPLYQMQNDIFGDF